MHVFFRTEFIMFVWYNKVKTMLEKILPSYGLQIDQFSITPIETGLINYTWRIKNKEQDYIVQKVNTNVFTRPVQISENVANIDQYLKLHAPGYLFPSPISATNGEMVLNTPDGHFRISNYVNQSHTIDTVENPKQAFEAAVQFGRFTKLLRGFPLETLHTTIPNFHNLRLRYEQFEQAFIDGNSKRIEESAPEIDFLKAHRNIVTTYNAITTDAEFKQRVTHHDTKISNVLFNDEDKAICVIDLDTVMPGYFISDVGDMMRTYLCPVSEEEKDISKIQVRPEYYAAIKQGYLQEMEDQLTSVEKEHFLYSGKFMIYMQALRFLTDHLKNDLYYGAKYPNHNFVRAKNQIVLLQKLMEKEAELNKL